MSHDSRDQSGPPSAGPSPTSSMLFFGTISRTTLAINKSAAGAGVLGLLGFAGLFIVSSVFFVTENYFLAMSIMSIALLVYVTGAELAKLIMSSVTIFFSSKHVIPEATQLKQTLVPLRDYVRTRRDEQGVLVPGPMEKDAILKLPDNGLVRDLKASIDSDQGRESAEYVAYRHYVECHELYDYAGAHLEFVAGAMPLFGLIGTIMGLIGMFDSLGSDVTVEFLAPQLALALKTTLYGAVISSVFKIIASRFDARLKALDYDYETFCRVINVLIDNRARIEVRK